MAPKDSAGERIDPASAEIGAETKDFNRTIAAEAFGSGILAFIVVAAGILGERFAIHNIGLALLMTVLAGSAAFMVLVRAFGAFAPCYFNPALAFVLTLAGRMKPQMGAVYAANHIVAAFLGVMIAHLVTNTGLVQVASQIQIGEGVWLGEFLGTMLFVLVLLMAMGPSSDRLPLTGGLSLLAIALATPSISFANPALTLARALTDSFTAIRLTDALIIAAVQMLAALCAWGVRVWFSRR